MNQSGSIPKGKENRVMADQALLYAALLLLFFIGLDAYLPRFGITFFEGGIPKKVLWVLKETAAAAFIGGIADWYGVSSLFGKPLFVPVQTEVVLRRKPHFVKSIGTFIGEDVLSTESIKRAFYEMELVDRLLLLIVEKQKNQNGVLKQLSALLTNGLLEALKYAETEQWGSFIHGELQKEIQERKLFDRILNGAKIFVVGPRFGQVASKLANNLKTVLEMESVKGFVEDSIDTAMEKYQSKARQRGFVAERMKEKLREGVYKGAEGQLDFIIRKDEKAIERWRGIFIEGIHSVETNEGWKDRVQWEILLRMGSEQDWTERLLKFLELDSEREKRNKKLEGWIEEALMQLLEKLLAEEKWRNQLEELLLENLIRSVEKNRETVQGFVETNLNQMKDEEWVGFLKDHSENDLQMIRLNGMFFGTFIGFVAALIKVIG